MTRAIIFDFDGTLVDTMTLHYEAYRRAFAEMGLDLSWPDFAAHIGGTGRETIPRFLGGRAAPWSVDAIHRRKRDLFADLLATVEVAVLPTARLLPLFSGRTPLAIASSGSRQGIESILRRLGWQDYFAALVTGEDVARGKPAPDAFLLAAARLEVPPGDCLVFEDTDDGVAAALAAGMSVIDVRCTPRPAVKVPGE